LKITVIGCWGGYPAKNEASSGYLIEHEDFRILLDCGSGVLSQLQNHIKPQKLNAVVLSHYHPDHIADIGVLQHALLIEKYLGNVSGTLPLYGHDLNEVEFRKLTYKDITKGVSYNHGKPVQIGPLTFTFLRTKHPVPCSAMRMESEGKVIVFTGDSSYMEELAEFSKGANLLLCESNFYSNQDGSAAGHMTAREAGILASKADVQLLMLTHLPHYGELSQLKKEASEVFSHEVVIAKTDMEFQL
jgi:ribonuclease BN (tRNA processing enzyme)